MDWIQCGDALWVSCSTWVAVWNGAIGAFVAAVIGGLVALGVVRLTNRHQSRLAMEQREKAAIADLCAEADSLVRRYSGGVSEITTLMTRATAASDRWRMETDHPGLASEIARWPQFVSTLALDAYLSDTGEGPAEEWAEFRRLAESVATLRGLLLEWPRAKHAERDLKVAELKRKRLAVESELASAVSSGDLPQP